MQLYFLRADVPLTKTFRRTEEGIEKTSYPFVKDFYSIEHPVNTIEEFAEALQFHADEKHCLLKGKLSRALHGESRAGTTDFLDTTQWVVFDVDGLTEVQTPEQFIQLLPEPFRKADYVVQLSASYGLTPGGGLRCHIFFLLEEPVVPSMIKGWLKHFNFECATLHRETDLSANGVTLKFPLDITVSQNDKLIYIAPPICEGVDDPHAGQRIRVVKGETRRVNFPFTHDVAFTAHQEQQRVNELRQERGLPRRQARYKTLSTGEVILSNPTTATVTGEKEMNGFIRLNLNGGDSWAYYYHPDKPRFLRNFKGEPTVILADFLPEYWTRLQEKMRQQGDANAEVCLIFNDSIADQLYKGTYDPINQRHQIYEVKNVQKLQWWADEHNTPMPDPVPSWRVEFRPDIPTVIDLGRRWLNLYQPSEIWKIASEVDEVETRIPFQVNRIINSICVDDETKEHFVNWLAAVVQKRIKTGTAWVFQGTQGTGKGLLVNHVLAPILGEDYVVTRTLDSMDDRFNSDLEKALVLCIDESSMDDARKARKTAALFKQIITEERMGVRGMRQSYRYVRSFHNLIITSNEFDPVLIDEGDRRYNIAPRQETPIDFTHEDYEMLQSEILEFATFLKSFKVDVELAGRAINTQAKESLRIATRNSIEDLVCAVKTADIEWIVGELAEGMVGGDFIKYEAACKRAEKYLDDALAGSQTIIRQADYIDLHQYFTGKVLNAGRVKKMLQRMHLKLPQVTTWKIDPFKAQELKKQLHAAKREVLA